MAGAGQVKATPCFLSVTQHKTDFLKALKSRVLQLGLGTDVDMGPHMERSRAAHAISGYKDSMWREDSGPNLEARRDTPPLSTDRFPEQLRMHECQGAEAHCPTQSESTHDGTRLSQEALRLGQKHQVTPYRCVSILSFSFFFFPPSIFLRPSLTMQYRMALNLLT